MEGDELAGEAADWLLRELGGKHRSQVLSTLAAVGVADVLQERGACSAADLAAQAGCELGALESLLRAAAGMGCLTEPSPGSFSLTPRGEQLCSDRLGAFADFLGSRTQWDAWSRLRDAMRDQDPASPLARALGRPLYEHLAADPAAAADYDAAIDAFTRHEAAQLRGRLDLQGVRAIVDVGGGRGTLLRALLEQADGARGVLFDLPHVVDGVRAALPPTIEAVSGDFLETVPAGGDLYLLKHVLHNWADDEARRILQHCRDARVATVLEDPSSLVVRPVVEHVLQQVEVTASRDRLQEVAGDGFDRRRQRGAHPVDDVRQVKQHAARAISLLEQRPQQGAAAAADVDDRADPLQIQAPAQLRRLVPRERVDRGVVIGCRGGVGGEVLV